MSKPLPTRNLINISAAALIFLGGFFAFSPRTSAELSFPATPCDDEQVDAILPGFGTSAHLAPGMIKEPGNVAFQYGVDNNSFVSKSGDVITFNVNLLFTPDNPFATIKLLAFDASCNIVFGFGPAFTELSPDREKVVTFDTSINLVSHDGNAQQLFPNFPPRYVWVEVIDRHPNPNLKTYSYLIDILDPQNPTGQPDTAPPGPPARNPVIIIPGIMGTELFHQSEQIWLDPLKALAVNDEFLDILMMDENGNSLDTIDVGEMLGTIQVSGVTLLDYSNGLINELVGRGYQENVDLFTFPYDWRRRIEDNTERLRVFIDATANGGKVNIVAHSMGGLLAKHYIFSQGNQKIDKLIFVGTPHLGAPDAAKTLIFGKPLAGVVNQAEVKKNS